MSEHLAEELKEKINQLLNDELLSDVSPSLSEKEIDSLIAVEKGQAFRIRVEREPLRPISKITMNKKKKKKRLIWVRSYCWAIL